MKGNPHVSDGPLETLRFLCQQVPIYPDLAVGDRCAEMTGIWTPDGDWPWRLSLAEVSKTRCGMVVRKIGSAPVRIRPRVSRRDTRGPSYGHGLRRPNYLAVDERECVGEA